MDGDDGNVQFACAYETTHVEEAAELQGIVSQLVDASRDADAEKLFTRYHQIVRLQTRINTLRHQVPCKKRHADWESSVLLQLAKYHEQAQLLDPHLHGIVVPLSAQLREHAGRGSQGASLPSVLTISRFLWDLVTVRQGTSLALLQCGC